MLPSEGGKLHLGINNCRDLYEKLQLEHNRLCISQYTNVYDVFNFVVTAHHLHEDWLNKDEATRPKLACRKRDKAPEGMKLMMKVVRDLTNGSKHMALNEKSTNKRVVEAIHPGEIKDWYSYFYEPHFWIAVGRYYLSTPVLVELIMSYFNWIFDDSIPVDDFPVEIEEQLNKQLAH